MKKVRTILIGIAFITLIGNLLAWKSARKCSDLTLYVTTEPGAVAVVPFDHATITIYGFGVPYYITYVQYDNARLLLQYIRYDAD